jgi:hypothetical protein
MNQKKNSGKAAICVKAYAALHVSTDATFYLPLPLVPLAGHHHCPKNLLLHPVWSLKYDSSSQLLG